MFWKSADVEREFGVKILISDKMERAIDAWDKVSHGQPSWVNAGDDIKSVNLAKHIADMRAKLTALDIGVAVSGSRRADYLQQITDDLLRRLPDKISDADALGGMIVKWNGESWDFVFPGNFGITEKDSSGNITGVIFSSNASDGDDHYTRLEYHRFEDDVYIVSNRAYKNRRGQSGNAELGRRVPLSTVEAWADLEDDVQISGLSRPLFGFYRVPGANAIDRSSPLGVSVFANAMTELEAIDVAISRKNAEIEDSKHITFVGQALTKHAQTNNIELPRFVQGLGMGLNDTETSAIHEHVPTLLTDQRIKDINFDLSLAGVKCGFSEGVFVLDGQTGMITATQVEADDRDTIQTIKADRDALKTALEQAIAGADALVTLYNLAPLGNYEVDFNFGDITYSYEEDKASWKSYVQNGWIPKWLYFVKFEGMSEEEAKAICAEAEAEAGVAEKELFGVE